MFQLGQFLRQRYATFLADHYHPDEVYILSSDYDRTISSAQALLAGLYIPRDNWNPTLNWDTIPIRTIPHAIDNVIQLCILF
jgi:lysosomal acid phosphatase